MTNPFGVMYPECHIIIICFSFPRTPPVSPKVKPGRSLSPATPPRRSEKEKKMPERSPSLAPPAPSPEKEKTLERTPTPPKLPKRSPSPPAVSPEKETNTPPLSPAGSHPSPTKSPVKVEPEVKVEHGAVPKLVILKKKCITKDLHDGEECDTCSDDEFESDHYDK